MRLSLFIPRSRLTGSSCTALPSLPVIFGSHGDWKSVAVAGDVAFSSPDLV